MKKHLLILVIAVVASLQACGTDPSGPGDPGSLVLTTWRDSTPVGVAGSWRLAGNTVTESRLSLNGSGAKFLFGGLVEHQGTIVTGRTLVVKFNGRESYRSLYAVAPSNEVKDCDCRNTRLEFWIQNGDSLHVGQCVPTPSLAKFHGWYVRVK